MGSTLTGNTLALTYPSLIKTTDNASLSAPKVLTDGVGNNSALTLGNSTGASSFDGALSIAGTLASTGNFSVNTNKFTVAAASGNTAVAGTLGVTGLTTLTTLNATGAATFSSTGAFTGNLTTSQTLTCRGLVQNDGAATSTFAGNVTIAGQSTFNGQVQFNGLLTFASATTFNAGLTTTTMTATTSSALGTASAGSLTTTSFISCGGNLTVTGNITGNGNVTIGDAAADALTLNAQTITAPNLPTVTVDPAADKIIVQDASDSNKLKLVAVQYSPVRKCAVSTNSYSYSPAFAAASTWSFIQSSSGVDWSVSFAPTANGNTLVVDVEVNLHIANNLNDTVAIGLFVDGSSVPSAVAFNNPYPYTSSGSTGRAATFRFRHSMSSSLASHAFKVGVIRKSGAVSDLIVNNQSPFTSSEVGNPKSSVFITEFQ